MEQLISLFGPLVISLAFLYGISRALDSTIMKLLGRTWYLVCMWPGVVVHELSHLLGCFITCTRVHEVKLFEPSGETLGYVSHTKTSNPIKNIVISIAPLFGISAGIFGVLWLFLPRAYAVLTHTTFSSFSDLGNIQNFLFEFFSQLDFSSIATYLGLYMLIALSSHAAPSSVDLKHTAYGTGGIIIFFAILLWIEQITATQIISKIVTLATEPFSWLAHIILLASIFSAFLLLLVSVPAILKRLIRI